jgi:hypothetical protein
VDTVDGLDISLSVGRRDELIHPSARARCDLRKK